jgi:diguanylate cyclase (GGDEF)-like protein
VLVAIATRHFMVSGSTPDPMLFGTLLAFATIAQLFEAEHGRQSYYPHFVFFLAGVFLIEEFLFFALLVTIPHLVEWIKERLTNSAHLRNWYIQPFNIAGHIIAGAAAYWAYSAINENMYASFTLSPVMAATIAVLVYVSVNHVLVGLALMLARGIPLQQSGALSIESVLPDLVMGFLGYIVSVLWLVNPWLILPALSPLVLMYQALMVPQLKQEAQTDSKTGLWNARHFSTLFSAELERAKRFNRPAALIMADLDLLRNINNTYGHLTGDAVLAGIGKIIRETIREYDIAGRFGGEEFAIFLPEASEMEVLYVAERLRNAVEATEFEVPTTSRRIHATMSIGTACFPADALTANELIHQADIAVYQAKLNGRNCVVAASQVPRFIKDGTALVEDRLSMVHEFEFVPRSQPAQPTPAYDPTTHNGDGPASHAGQAVSPDVQAEDRHSTATLEQQAGEDGAHAAHPTSNEHYERAQVADTTPGIEGAQEHAVGTPPSVPSVEVAPEPPPSASPAPPAPARGEASLDRSRQKWVLWVFLSAVIAAGTAIAVLGFILHTRFDGLAVGLLVAIAIIAELFKINLYGDNTISVSVAVVFAAALIAGIPGVVCVSAAIALAHYVQMRPAVYKVPFNWSAHVLAGAAPAIAMGLTQIPLESVNLPLLVLPLSIAAFAYYMIDTGLVAGAIALSKGLPLVPVWQDHFRWLAGHYMVLCGLGLFLTLAFTSMGVSGVVVFSLPVLMMRYAQKQYVERTSASVRELQRMNRELAEAHEEVLAVNQAMRNLNDELFITLSKIIDARDPYMGGHATKVSEYATAIGMELGLPPERLELLRQAGFLHDIGKIAISEQVLQKQIPLTVAEYEYIKTHAAIGGEFLEMCGPLRHLAPFVRHHHERWDGQGYPNGLKGEEIPLEARILAVCDAAEAMASDRPYRRGMSLAELVSEVKRCSGTQFDPTVVEAFLKVVGRDKEQLVVNSALDVMRTHSNRPTGRPYSYTDRLHSTNGRARRTAHLVTGQLATGKFSTGTFITSQLATNYLSLSMTEPEAEGFKTLAGTGPLTGPLATPPRD